MFRNVVGCFVACLVIGCVGVSAWAQAPAASRAAAPRPAKAAPKPTGPPAAATHPPAGAKESARSPTLSGERQVARDAAAAAAKFYNAGDAKSLAALFAADGEVIDADGDKTQGRDRIERMFEKLFAAHPGRHMDISIDSIRAPGPSVILEEGSSAVSDPKGGAASRRRYSIVHAKQPDGRWLMTRVRDFADEAAVAKSALEDLGWLAGEWVDEHPAALVKTTYGWTDKHAFLVSEFTTQERGKVTMTGSQRIGWDPRENKIHSWVFDSEGGFAQGLWTREGERWIVKLTGITRDGRSASATQIIKRLSNDRYSWQSRDRIVGDHVMSDTEELIVVRRPPGPELQELPKK